MPDDFQYDVFLSHNHADKPQVRRLKAAGVKPKAEGGRMKAEVPIHPSSFASGPPVHFAPAGRLRSPEFAPALQACGNGVPFSPLEK